MSDGPNALGDYLRARRELVTPEQAGVPVLSVRRVPGLRREEVAMLAGISADYYLRLEQGRDRNPSAQVLESLARVLQLDADATGYLLGLGADKPRRPRRRPRREIVPPGIAKLVATIGLPAFVEGRYFDVLAANALAMALSPRLAPGGNRLRDVFLDPAERSLYPNWDRATGNLVAGFRQSVGTDTDDPRFIELVGELSLASPRFRQLWARHDVLGRGRSRDSQPPAGGRAAAEPREAGHQRDGGPDARHLPPGRRQRQRRQARAPGLRHAAASRTPGHYREQTGTKRLALTAGM